jgi:hypothetical protein
MYERVAILLSYIGRCEKHAYKSILSVSPGHQLRRSLRGAILAPIFVAVSHDHVHHTARALILSTSIAHVQLYRVAHQSPSGNIRALSGVKM